MCLDETIKQSNKLSHTSLACDQMENEPCGNGQIFIPAQMISYLGMDQAGHAAFDR